MLVIWKTCIDRCFAKRHKTNIANWYRRNHLDSKLQRWKLLLKTKANISTEIMLKNNTDMNQWRKIFERLKISSLSWKIYLLTYANSSKISKNDRVIALSVYPFISYCNGSRSIWKSKTIQAGTSGDIYNWNRYSCYVLNSTLRGNVNALKN